MRNWILIGLTLMATACGKKMADVTNQQAQLGGEVLSKIYSIKYHHSALASQTVIPRNANFKIPDHFSFIAEADLNQEIEILYNFNPNSFVYEFRCFYRPQNQVDEFQLNRCLDFAGNNLGQVTEVDFMLDEGKVILFRSQETQNFHFTIDYQVDWK